MNPKFLFSVAALAVSFSLLALTACDSDTSSNPSSEGAKSGFQCDVSRSGNSVHVIESYQGLVHEVTIEVSLDDDGHKKADITEKVTYPDASVAPSTFS